VVAARITKAAARPNSPRIALPPPRGRITPHSASSCLGRHFYNATRPRPTRLLEPHTSHIISRPRLRPVAIGGFGNPTTGQDGQRHPRSVGERFSCGERYFRSNAGPTVRRDQGPAGLSRWSLWPGWISRVRGHAGLRNRVPHPRSRRSWLIPPWLPATGQFPSAGVWGTFGESPSAASRPSRREGLRSTSSGR
jgi:hypothetical protein